MASVNKIYNFVNNSKHILPALISCLVFVYIIKQPDPVKQYCAWLGLLGAGAYITVLAAFVTGTDGWLFVTVPYAFFLALYVAGSTKKFALPLKIPALCALCAATYAAGVALFIGEGFEDTEAADLIGAGVCALLFLIPAAFLGRGSYKKNPLRAVFTALFGAVFVLLCVFGAVQDITDLLQIDAVCCCSRACCLWCSSASRILSSSGSALRCSVSAWCSCWRINAW